MSIIELRSDTFTRPSQAMRQAIAEAEVGDDVWGEDPTVLHLQRQVAELLGKEAALFVASGTMANQVALLSHTHHGDEVLVGWRSHCTTYEAGAGAALAGVMFKTLGENGIFTAHQILTALPPRDVHFAQPTLVWLENTHNAGGGKVFPQHEVERIATVAGERKLALHLDGARLMHAAVALGRPARELVAPVDSCSICLSKGLGAPAGSVLAGSADFIRRAHRFRKMLGGGMRQVGILAAAGIYALEHNVQRLTQDHENAQLLAQGLARVSNIRLDPKSVETNIVIFEIEERGPELPAFLDTCREAGLLLAGAGGRRIRAVVHLDVSREQCQQAVQIVARVMA